MLLVVLLLLLLGVFPFEPLFVGPLDFGVFETFPDLARDGLRHDVHCPNDSSGAHVIIKEMQKHVGKTD